MQWRSYARSVMHVTLRVESKPHRLLHAFKGGFIDGVVCVVSISRLNSGC